MTYPETLKYLESFINYERYPAWPYKESLRLERIENFLKIIGNPQEGLKCIHVAGSKGKGSTCAFIAYILRESGFKVGLYTSPHLCDFRERIRILLPEAGRVKVNTGFEGTISRQELAGITTAIKPGIVRFNKSSKFGPLTFFEAITAVAFLYFKKKNVDFAVLETGLGGRLDATNMVKPLVSVITPISYEHTQKLGNTLGLIAQEKAGIIKFKTEVISAPQRNEAMQVIERCSREKKSRLSVARRIPNKYIPLNLKLLGRHQLINAATAISAIESLSRHGINIKIDAIKDGLNNTVWPGRCEVISKNPYCVLDGAQNVASAQVIRKAVLNNFKFRKLILVLGVSDDKDIQGICHKLSAIADKVILTKSSNPRATTPAVLAKYFMRKEKYFTDNVASARILALRLAGKNDLILVTGSLFVVGDFRRC